MKAAPVGFQNIRLAFTLDTDASEEQLATLTMPPPAAQPERYAAN